MKDKLLLFIIGVLVGAVISTGAFITFSVTNNSNKVNNQGFQMNGGTPPGMPGGSSGSNFQPPEMPSNNNTQSK